MSIRELHLKNSLKNVHYSEKYLKGGSGKELIKKKWSETNHEV